MTQWAEEILNSIHNLNLPDRDDWELCEADIKEELVDFNKDELTLLHQNLTRIKRLVLNEKNKQRRRAT